MNKQQRLTSFVLFVLNLILHLPFLFMGYGKEEDAWSNVLNARTISSTGIYEVSRLPGHPLHELLLSKLYPWLHTPFFFNGLSALATAGSVAFFYNCLVRLKIQNASWLALTFTFIPVFFIAGTYTIDYNFALCFILASFSFFINKKWVIAGVLLGLATGFRISSIGFLLPFVLFGFSRKDYFKSLLLFSILSVATAIVPFLLPYSTYGWAFLDFHKPPFPPLANILYKLSFGIWGVPLSAFLVYLILKNTSRLKQAFKKQRVVFIMAVIAILMQLAVFLRLPFKSEFFIPALPFVILFIGLTLTKKQSIAMALAAFCSTFFMGFDYHQSERGGTPSPLSVTFEAGGKQLFFDLVKGPVFLDQSKRKQKSKLVSKVVRWTERQEYPYHVIGGWYWAELAVKLPASKMNGFDYFSTEQELIEATALGKNVYYLPEMNQANAEVYNHYFADSLGQVLRPL